MSSDTRAVARPTRSPSHRAGSPRAHGRSARTPDRRPTRRSYVSSSDVAARNAALEAEFPVSTARPLADFAATGLPVPLVQALSRHGLERPFAIQSATIPDALTGRDLLGRAETGSGKTLAFGLPMLARLTGRRAERRRPLGLVLVPTRELAMQVSDALRPYAGVVGLRLRLIAGGMPYGTQIDSLGRGVEILVATPGRLIDLMDRGIADLAAVEVAVLDEADQMCDMGFTPAVTRILDQTPAGGQRMLFSATLDGDVDRLVRRYLDNPVRHSTAPVTASVTTMEHHLFVVHPTDKARVTAELAAGEGRSIVFVRTKLAADRVAAELRGQGVQAVALHGGLGQGARTRTLSAFKDGAVPVLVATDVAARGLHVDDVALVIQADPPGDHKTYLHRAGRTARAGDSGRVVTLAMPRERRTAEQLTRAAGVSTTAAHVHSGHVRVQELNGGAVPSGRPVAEYVAPVRNRRPAGAPARNRRPSGKRRA